MSRFAPGGFPPPPEDAAGDLSAEQSRLLRDQVTLGAPLRIRGDVELRRDIENSLEALAKKRLLEAEESAEILMAQARKGAADVLEKAASQVQDMLSRMQAQVDGIRENAREEGFKEGFQEGYSEGLAQASAESVQALQSAQVLMDAAWLAQKQTMEDFEAQMLAMLSHLARKILGRELQQSPEALMGLLRQAVDSLYLSGKTQVVIHPDVLHALREFDAATRSALDEISRLEFIADPGLKPSKIYVIAQEGCFDLSPDTQTERLLEAVRPHLRLPRDGDPPPLPALPHQEKGDTEPPFRDLELALPQEDLPGNIEPDPFPEVGSSPLPALPHQGEGDTAESMDVSSLQEKGEATELALPPGVSSLQGEDTDALPPGVFPSSDMMEEEA